MKPNKENTLYLPIKQKYFDEILSGKKTKEYREIKDTTGTKYLISQKVDGEVQYMYDPDEISEEKMAEYANYLFIYNDGVYPYIPKDIYYLDLAVGYAKERDTLTVEVEDITFEPMQNERDEPLRFSYDEKKDDFVDARDGDLCAWQIVFHLGKIIKKDLKKDR